MGDETCIVSNVSNNVKKRKEKKKSSENINTNNERSFTNFIAFFTIVGLKLNTFIKYLLE